MKQVQLPGAIENATCEFCGTPAGRPVYPHEPGRTTGWHCYTCYRDQGLYRCRCGLHRCLDREAEFGPSGSTDTDTDRAVERLRLAIEQASALLRTFLPIRPVDLSIPPRGAEASRGTRENRDR